MSAAIDPTKRRTRSRKPNGAILDPPPPAEATVTAVTEVTEAPTAPEPEPAPQPAQPAPAQAAQEPPSARAVEGVRQLRPYTPPAGEGWTEAPPMLVYDPEANDYAPVEAMAVDVREWGGGLDVIIMRPRAPLRVRLASGEVVDVAAKSPIAVPAVCQLLSVAAALATTEEALLVVFAPIAVRTVGNGRQFTEYHVAWRSTGIPRRMLWESQKSQE
jgi:hypothetical protein